jgi:nucleotide-binding universal stress UspA family protein
LKILVCTDGSKTACEAVHFTGELGKDMAADITLLHVEVCFLCPVVPSLRSRIMRFRRGGSESILEKGFKTLEGFNLRASKKTRVGNIESEILSEANHEDYGLVVIGSQGIKGIEMFFFGALTYKLIERVRKPVLVIKKGRKSIKRILVCTGGSAQASNAVDFAAKMNKAINAHVSLLYVAERDDSASSADGFEVLRKAEQRFAGEGKVEKLLLYGQRSKKIIETTKRGDYDLVVLGETSMNPLKLLVSGSVVYEVLKRINTPCLIVKQ